jgi:hypothetical protein
MDDARARRGDGVTAWSLPTIERDGFSLTPVSGAVPCARFSGTADIHAVPEVNRFLEVLHTELLGSRANAVEIELRELYFMNSSCLKAFVSWVHKVNTTGRPYQIKFLTNRNLRWQARSISTLQRLAPAVVLFEELG